MTILGRGDLSPPRRHGHGRRRGRWARVLLVLVLLAGLGAAAYYGWHRWRDDTDTVATATLPCASARPTAEPPQLGNVRVRVLNGSLKAGLAARVGKQLHRTFGVEVTRVGNAPRFVRGASVIRFPARLTAQARVVAALVVPPASLRVTGRLAHVELDIGTAFRGVARNGGERQVGAASPSPTPVASGSACAGP